MTSFEELEFQNDKITQLQTQRVNLVARYEATRKSLLESTSGLPPSPYCSRCNLPLLHTGFIPSFSRRKDKAKPSPSDPEVYTVPLTSEEDTARKDKEAELADKFPRRIKEEDGPDPIWTPRWVGSMRGHLLKIELLMQQLRQEQPDRDAGIVKQVQKLKELGEEAEELLQQEEDLERA